MYNLLLRRGTTVAFVIGFIASLLIVFLLVNGVGDTPSDAHEILYGVPQFGTTTMIAIVIGGIYGIVTNPKGSLKFIIGLAVFAAVFGILYAIGKVDDASYIPLRNSIEEFNVGAGISKMINAGLIGSLILLGIAFFAVLLAEVRNAFK